MKAAVLLPLALAVSSAAAEEQVSICYNYSCLAEATIHYSEAQLASVRKTLARADNAEQERAALALVVGRLYVWAGQQSPVWRDRGGDYRDEGVDGRMDCIDHARSTTRLLRMLETRGWLRYHRVQNEVRRTRFLITQHFSAVVEEKPPAALLVTTQAAPRRYVIDSWFRDNGEPAVVLPLEDWMNGEGPNDN